MRVNRLFTIGRLELYVGRRTYWDGPQWDAWPTNYGYELRAGHWHFIGEWVPKPRPHADVLAELLAEAAASGARDRAARCWPARAMP